MWKHCNLVFFQLLLLKKITHFYFSKRKSNKRKKDEEMDVLSISTKKLYTVTWVKVFLFKDEPV